MSYERALNVRMPDELRERLRLEAKVKKRSLNAEIVYRLRRSLEGYSR